MTGIDWKRVMAHEEDRAFSSVYDGIQEYDNDLPLWWVYLFYGTIIFSVGYVIYYHVGGPGLGQEQLLAVEMRALEDQKKSAAPVAASSELSLLALVSNAAAIEKGKGVYVGKCAACHGTDGQGLVGPNLVDKHWLHGGKISDVHRTIEQGVIAKGMLAWKGVIPAQEIDAVTAYVWSLRGTNPPNQKAPQGELVAE
jgi:cytochrome c oxidase cbb3-type subunit 3